jgi:hypothetical protein
MGKASGRPLGGHSAGGDVEQLLVRIRGLVYARAILEERGASKGELDEFKLETERLRTRLADIAAGGNGSHSRERRMPAVLEDHCVQAPTNTKSPTRANECRA